MKLHPLAAERIEGVLELCNSWNLQAELLKQYSYDDSRDHVYYHILINGHILYTATFGDANVESTSSFFGSIHKIAKKHTNDEALQIILDTRGLTKLPTSARNEVYFFNQEFRDLWSNVIYINQGVAKAIFDVFETKSTHAASCYKKVPSLKAALSLVLNDGSLPNNEKEDGEDYQKYTKEELIKEVERLNAEKKNYKLKCNDSLDRFFSHLVNLSLQTKDQISLSTPADDSDLLAPAYNLINSLLADYYDLEDKHEKLNNRFNKELGAAVGETYRQEASLRAIFNSLDSILWFIDSDYKLISFNERFTNHSKKYFGITPHVGLNIKEEYSAHKNTKRLETRVNHALAGEEKTYIDYYKTKNGVVEKVVDTKIFPVEYDNKIIGAACLSKDITESYFYKEKIKSNEKILASVNKNIKEALYRSAHERGLIYINDAFVKMFGYDSKEELYEHSNLDTIYANPGERKRLSDLLNEEKEVSNVEVFFRRKDGSTFTGLLSSIVTVGEDGLSYFDGAIRDISYVKETQQQLKSQNDELSKLNEELDSFVYSASHDLKAPLSSVKGLINIAKKVDTKEELDSYLELMDKSISKLDSFIQDIIDLSRNSRKELNQDQIKFPELIEEVFSNFEYIEGYDLISKNIDIDAETPFYTDKSRLKVILNNLISNAIRYYNPRSENPYIDVRIKISDGKVKIVVSDNGIGIEQEFLDKIFNMFFRASYNSQGSGIGLYIVKETLIKLGGSVHVDSKPKEGTSFTIELPNLKHIVNKEKIEA